jgi:hypothetical protein
MVLGVEFTEAEPAKLELTLGAFHKFAALATHDHYVTRRTHLREEHLVQIAISVGIVDLGEEWP